MERERGRERERERERDLAHFLNCSELPLFLLQITLCLLTSIHLQINSKQQKLKLSKLKLLVQQQQKQSQALKNWKAKRENQRDVEFCTVWRGYVMSWAMIPPPAPESPLIKASDIFFSGKCFVWEGIFLGKKKMYFKALREKIDQINNKVWERKSEGLSQIWL